MDTSKIGCLGMGQEGSNYRGAQGYLTMMLMSIRGFTQTYICQSLPNDAL